MPNTLAMPAKLLLFASLLTISFTTSSPIPDSYFKTNRRIHALPKHRVLAELSTNNSTSSSRSKNRTSPHVSAYAPAPAPASHDHKHHSRKKRVKEWAIGLVVGSIGGMLSGALLSALYRMLVNCIRRRFRNPAGPMIYSPMIKKAEFLAFLEKDEAVEQLEKIGEGGSGVVFKAPLPGTPERPGKVLAVKRIMKPPPSSDKPGGGGEPHGDDETKQLDKWMKQIRSEIKTVGQMRHRNLLPLVAHVARPDRHYLVYEFMKNGSLREALSDAASGRRELDWPTRLRIALGIASGLEYLHYHHSPRVIHRDLKTANVLLDDNMEARIADFGLAKAFPDSQTHMSSANVAGTLGYIAPEYHQTMRFTEKCDMYSLGVLLMVLVSGKEPIDDFFGEEMTGIVKWVQNAMAMMDPVAIVVDRSLIGCGYEEQIMLVLKVACFCAVDSAKDRPSSKDVHSMLNQIKMQ